MKQSLCFEKVVWKSIIFMLFLYVLCLCFRISFILYIGVGNGVIGDVISKWEYIHALTNGMRYDGQTIGALAVIFFFFSLVLGRSRFGNLIVNIFVGLVIAIFCFVNIANIGFYQIYGDVFNTNLLGLVFDDREAIFKTALSGQYHLSLKIFIWIACNIVSLWILRILFSFVDYFYRETNRFHKNKNQQSFLKLVFIFSLFGFSALFAINGHLGLKGVSLGKEIKPVENTFLRKITAGAFRDLIYVYKAYEKIYHSSFGDYINEIPQVAVNRYFAKNFSQDSQINLLDLLKHTSHNTSEVKIEHIFYIIAESLSEWHFDKRFDSLGLTSELQKIIDESHAYKADVFLQNAGNTIGSLDSQISGLFHTGIPLSLMVGRMGTFQTAPAVIFKDLGFKTHFYYGGSCTWQKLDSYIDSQGFDDILCSTHIVQNSKIMDYPSPYENSWGAYDHHLFSFIRDKILLSRGQRTFNMIMTTSNHPPYDAPVESFGAPIKEIEEFLKNDKEFIYKDTSRQILAHIWYQDKVIAKFINDMKERFPNSLFVVTGDHYDREYPYPNITERISNSVPLIVYAPKLQPMIISNVGSHIDITPTIVELVAPDGYEYMSFGKPLLGNKAIAYDDRDYALGFFGVANDRFVFDGHKIEYFNNGLERSNDKELSHDLFMNLNRAKAFSWWILSNGYSIPTQHKK